MSVDHYTYRVTWSAEDGEHVGLCAEFPSQSWLAKTPEAALKGIRRVVSEAVADMQAAGEEIPVALAEKHYSGEFRVRIPPQVHRALATQAVEQGVSLNRLASALPKSVRINAHVSHEVYETLRRAAELTGATVNQFLVQAALKEAQVMIERKNVIHLSTRDWNWLLDLMENPPKPNAKLKAAMKRHQKALPGNAGN